MKFSFSQNRHELNLEDCIKLFMKEEELAAEERPVSFLKFSAHWLGHTLL